jgi:hypothetical protein
VLDLAQLFGIAAIVLATAEILFSAIWTVDG